MDDKKTEDTRVGCILESNDKEVKFLGYGKLVGAEIPHDKVVGFGERIRKAKQKNPKIILDSGKDVFGCECWWNDEEVIKKRMKGLIIIDVDIDEVRKEQRGD